MYMLHSRGSNVTCGKSCGSICANSLAILESRMFRSYEGTEFFSNSEKYKRRMTMKPRSKHTNSPSSSLYSLFFTPSHSPRHSITVPPASSYNKSRLHHRVV
jgi:hypothetical protein